MHCAECGSHLKQHPSGAYYICCNGPGYLTEQPPEPRDMRASPLKFGKWWLYLNNKWPAGNKPVMPVTRGGE